jgi:hypothetical protein
MASPVKIQMLENLRAQPPSYRSCPGGTMGGGIEALGLKLQ